MQSGAGTFAKCVTESMVIQMMPAQNVSADNCKFNIFGTLFFDELLYHQCVALQLE